MGLNLETIPRGVTILIHLRRLEHQIAKLERRVGKLRAEAQDLMLRDWILRRPVMDGRVRWR